jgi:hypothetical protein
MKKKSDDDKDDSARRRGLMDMMWGQLDDRKETEEVVELTKPEWMLKPKEEMSDEEKKLVKEFDKKLTIYREEQEKAKKALETELRKLQLSVNEICECFNSSLSELQKTKTIHEKIILQDELQILMLAQACICTANDDFTEISTALKIEQLKKEKAVLAAEIPEVKKELERRHEDYENAIKKEKEIDKAFRKEFHSSDFYFETLYRLFNRTNRVEGDARMENENLNPFFKYQAPDNFSLLNSKTDMPEGLDKDIWKKLVEIREKKIAIDMDVKATERAFRDMQKIVQNVIEDSEKIRVQIERLTNDIEQFAEYKFQATHNIVNIYSLKQGQVEIVQSPLVTDFSNSILINRNVVENLNNEIKKKGNAKVEALNEIKDYRRGIHTLEWFDQLT